MTPVTQYSRPENLRRAIDARLVNEAGDTGLPINRLRRRIAFERLLARLEATEPGRWILKGGMALEMRWLERARTTKDLDLATRHQTGSSEDLRDALIAALAPDPDGDGFRFEIAGPTTLSENEAGRPGWRVSVKSLLAGRTFAAVKLDVVARTSEATATERVRLPGALSFAGVEVREVEVIALAQHFAEKLHAMTRTYGGDRPSTRVRDLTDLVLVIEQGPPSVDDVNAAAVRVFDERATHPIPDEIPDPPANWRKRYEDDAGELDLGAASFEQALELVRAFWSSATNKRQA